MIRMCSSLAGQGHDVTLVGRHLPRSLPLPQFSFNTKRIRCQFSKGPAFYAEYNTRLYLYLKKTKADILGSVDYDTLKAVTRAGRRIGAKVIFDAHEWFEEVPELAGRDKVKRYWMKIARQGLPKTDVRYAVSEGVAEQMKRTYNQSFNVIHNYPLLAAEEPSAIRDDILLYLGVLNKGRGLPELIMAMREIDAKLWIVGDGDIREQLWSLVAEHQLMEKVSFKGFVPPEELPTYLSKARIGINLLDGSSESYRYSLANKFFDYVHAGMPQVCMDFPEYRRYNQMHNVATLISDLKQRSIVYAINHLLGDRNFWFTFHVSCLEARKEWCWEKEEPKLLELVSNL